MHTIKFSSIRHFILPEYLCAILVILFIIASPIKSFGWGGENHKVITKAALPLLPEWERDILGVYADSLIQRYCLIPDHYRNPDFEKVYAPYIEIPFLPASSLYHKSEDAVADLYIFIYFAEKAVEYLRADNIREASRFIGTLTHFIEDNSCPVHVVDNGLLTKLLPPPSSIENFSVHGAVESPVMTIPAQTYQPKKIGETVFASYEPFVRRFQTMQNNSRAQAVPIVEGIYEENQSKSDTGRVLAVEPAIELLTDVLHTIFCIAFNR